MNPTTKHRHSNSDPLQSHLTLSSFKKFIDSEHRASVQDLNCVTPSKKSEKPRKFPLETKSNDQIHISKPLSNSEKRSSNKLCSSCLRYMQIIEDYQRDQQKTNEKYFNTEKHLKQYDALLLLKDKRLQEQEISLKTESERLEKEKETVLNERKKLESDKAELELMKKERETILGNEEKLKEELQRVYKELDMKLKLINKKEEELQSVEMKYQEQLTINREHNTDKVLRNSVLADYNSGFDEKLEKLKEKKKKLKDLDAKIQHSQLDLEKKKEIFHDTEKQIKAEKKILDDTKESITEDLESINELKVILKIQEENLNRERRLMQDKYEEKFAYVEELKIKVSERLQKLMDEKELFSGNCEENKQDREKSEELQMIVIKLEKELKCVKEERKELNESYEKLEELLKDSRCNEEDLKRKNSELEQIIFDHSDLKTRLDSLLQIYEQNSQTISVLISENKSLSTTCIELKSLNCELQNELESLKHLKISTESQINFLPFNSELNSKQVAKEEEKNQSEFIIKHIKSKKIDLKNNQLLQNEEDPNNATQQTIIAEQDKKIKDLLRFLTEKEEELFFLKRKMTNF